MTDQRRQYYGGATGDGLVYDEEEDRWDPTPLEDVPAFATLSEDVDGLEADLAEEVTSRGDEDDSLQRQLDVLRADYRLLLQAWICRFGLVPKLARENVRALQQQGREE